MEDVFAWILSRDFRQYLLDNNLFFFPFIFAIRMVGMTAVELISPARFVSYRHVFLQDCAAFGVYQYFIVSWAGQVDHFIHNHIVPLKPHLPDAVVGMPLPVRVLCYLVIGDLGQYWIHRLLHAKYVWRVHQWHHSPTYMYWLAGVRATVPQQALVNIPHIVAFTVLELSPWWMGLSIALLHVFQNDWMHLNVSWRLKWMEWLLVTPHFHHIHHSDKPEHYKANLGILLTVWDRLFGTYVDPDSVKTPLSFGIGEQVPTVRLIAGV